MSDFLQQTGKVAFGSRLRRLSERFAQQATHIYALYKVELDPKWFPVFHYVSQFPCSRIRDIAEAVGHSHVSVSKIVKEMGKAGVVITQRAEGDARQTLVSLSPKGEATASRLSLQLGDIDTAMTTLFAQSNHQIMDALDELEYLLEQRGLFERVRDAWQVREQQRVRIVDYDEQYQRAYTELNYSWIKRYFDVEQADVKSLEHPKQSVLQDGGFILIALLDDEPVGTCAMLKQPGNQFELAKMAVAERAQGRRIGILLGEAALQRARSLRADSVYLESNTKLVPALSIYRKLGFKQVPLQPSPYTRCNIRMAIEL